MVFLKKAATLLLFATVVGVSAQSLGETYVHPDGEFAFDYDADWIIEMNDDDTVNVESDDFFLTVSPPSAVSNSALSAANDTDEVVEALMESLAEQVDFERPRRVEFANNLTGTRVYFSMGSGRSVTNGVLVSVDLDGQLCIILAIHIGSEPAEVLDAITPLIESFRLDGGRSGGVLGQLRIGSARGSGSDLELSEYDPTDMDSQWETIVEELETLELIPARGELLHEEDVLMSATVTGMETFRETRTSAYQNFVIAALISYRPFDEDSLFCGFLSNVVGSVESSGNIPLLFIGANAENSLVVLESGAGDEDVEFFTAEAVYDWYNPVHLVAIVNDGVLTVFVDGQLAIEDYELSYLPETGTRVSAGVNLDNSCVMTGYFVYGVQ